MQPSQPQFHSRGAAENPLNRFDNISIECDTDSNHLDGQGGARSITSSFGAGVGGSVHGKRRLWSSMSGCETGGASDARSAAPDRAVAPRLSPTWTGIRAGWNLSCCVNKHAEPQLKTQKSKTKSEDRKG